MTILYTVFARFPNEKANGKQVKEVCNSLVKKASVTLLVSNRATPISLEGFGLDPQVKLVRLPVIDLIKYDWLGKYGWAISMTTFLFSASLYTLGTLLSGKKPVVITRQYWCAFIPLLLRIPTVWEAHRDQWNMPLRFAIKLKVHFFVISKGLYNFYLEKGLDEKRLTLVPDGVDISRYEDLPSKSDARNTLSLDPNKIIVVYNGHLHTWKGADTLAEAASYLPEGSQVIFMGGTDGDIEMFRKKYGQNDKISIIGRKDDSMRPVYLRAADALVLPNTAKNEISVKYTSPLKLFGYMATGVPIVSSDLPSIREIVSEKEVFFAEPDVPKSFADAILYITHNPKDAENRAKNAQTLVQKYAWDVRADTIIDTLGSLAKSK